ncbi:MAG: hypothetical protein P4L50_23930 [Anaerolineaceae bacterium]|nr:hypothetical protein [Anaerolineaceae bacterium]
MSIKTIGLLLIVVGVLVIAFVFVAPALHIGSANIFTLKKMGLAVVGLIALVAGVVLSMQKKTAA